MKINKSIIFGSLLALFCLVGAWAEPLEEGWHILTEAPVAGSPSTQVQPIQFGAMAMTVSEIPLRIRELASALQTPERMFEFVYNTIDYVPAFGLLKGAERTLLDSAGTDADQADLLIQLLRAEGYTASFAYGKLDLPFDSAADGFDLANWIGVESADVGQALDLAGIGSLNGIDRVWVWLDTAEGGVDLDPAFKRYDVPDGIDIGALSGLNLSSLLAAAGGDLNGTAVSNMNETALYDYLDSLSSNLAHEVRSQYANEEVEDLLGLRQIIQEEVGSLSGRQRYTATSRSVESELPPSYFHTMRLVYGSLDRTLNFHDIAASDLTVTYADMVAASSAPSGNPEPLMQSFSAPISESIEINGVSDPLSLNSNVSDTVWISDNGAIQSSAVVAAADPVWTFGEVFNRVPYHTSEISQNIYQGSLTPTVTFISNSGNAYKNLSYKDGNDFYLKIQINGSGQTAGTKSGRIRITLGTQNLYINLDGSVIDVPLKDHGNINETQNAIYNIRSQVSGATNEKLTLLSNPSGAYTTYFEGGIVKTKLDSAGQTRGQKTATLLYEFDYSGASYEWIFDLTGWIRKSPDLSGSLTWDFGTKYAHETKQGTLVLKNSGDYALQFNGAILSGNDINNYWVNFSAGSVASGNSINLTPIYNVSSVGVHNDAYIGVSFVYDEISYSWNDFFPIKGTTAENKSLQLLQDDSLVEEFYALSGADSKLSILIDHPYVNESGVDSGLADQLVSYPIQTNGTYAILLGFGQGQHGGALRARQQKQAELLQSGLANDAPEMIAQSLHVMGNAWLQESSLNSMLSEVVSGSRIMWHHRVGMAAQEAGYYVDIKAQIAVSASSADEDYLSLLAMIPSAMEHGVLEQYQGSDRPAASTIKLLKLANDQGLQVFRLGADDFSGARSALLAGGYSSNELDEMSNNTYLYGSIYILPEQRSVGIINGDWSGNGHIEKRPSSMAMVISGSYGSQNGGYSFLPGNANANLVYSAYEPAIPPPANLQSHRAADPVDMTSGFYVFDHADLSMSGPISLVFSRHYSSGSVDQKGAMGHGWTHSYNIHAQEHSAYADGMGMRSYEDAVPAILAHAAVRELTKNSDTPQGWLAATLTAQWAMNQLTENAVSIYVGQKVITFIEQPDDTYTAPPGMTIMLEKSILTDESYVMRERHGKSYIFDGNLNLKRIDDQHSNTLTFSYNTQTNLQTVTSSFGPEFTFGYTGDLLTSVSDNDGRSVSYQYNSNNLTNYIDPEGFEWGVGYDSEHRVKWMKDPEQVTTIQNFYNSIGQITNQISSSGNDWGFYFTGTRNVSEDPLGNQTAYYLDSKDRTWSVEHPNGAQSYSVFDGQNHIVESIAPNNVTNTFVYDVDHNLLATTNAVGLPEQVVSAFGYDSDHHLRFVTNAVGASEQTVTETTYTTEHKIDTVTVAKDTALETVTDYNYTTDGLIQQVFEGNGKRITTFNYDSNSQYGHPKITTSTDAEAVTTVYGIQGNLKSQTVGGKTTEFDYDDRRLPIGTTYAKGSADEFSISQTYWKNGLLKTFTGGRGKTTRTYWTDAYKEAGSVFPNTGNTTNIYDEVDRLVHSRDAEGNWATNTLDNIGQVVAVESAYAFVTNQFDVVGNLTNSVVDPAGLNLWTTSTYDNLGRSTITENALSEIETQYDRLNRATNSVDTANKDWKTEYDALGRVKKTFRPSGNYEEVGYDNLGSRTAFWNAEFKPMTFGVDAQGRVTSITNAVTKITSFGYDDAENLEWKLNAEDELTQYGYDALNRMVAITNKGLQIAVFDHDNNGNTVLASDVDTMVALGYDEMNRLTASTQSVNGVTAEVGYGFDLNGNRTNIVYPGGLAVGYIYGADNRLESVTIKYLGNTKTASFGYDSANRLNSVSFPNGVTSTIGQNAEGRITNIKHGTFIDRTIQRNTLGFKETELIDAGLKPTAPETSRRIKTHNDADQLTSEWVQQGSNEYTVTYNYSDNGSLTSSVSTASSTGYSYDYADRLESVSQSANIVYLYEASGARVGRIDGITTNYFVVDYADGLKRPLAETDASGTITRYFVWSGARLICHIEVDSTTRYYHSDELGSTLALTDELGNVTDQFAYMPYGYATHTAYAGSSDTPFQWLGGYGVYYDSDTDLHLTLHRAYSCKLKRFISSDPLGIDGGVNVYAMANRNPLFFIDPYGLSGLESRGIYDEPYIGYTVDNFYVETRSIAQQRVDEIITGIYNELAWERINSQIDRDSIQEDWNVTLGLAGGLANLIRKPVVSGIATYADDIAPKSAFKTAQHGGKHAGQLKQFQKWTPDQVQKSINTFDKNIVKHQKWIDNPASKVKNWDKLTKQHQQNLLHHWQQDINRAQELKSIAIEVLK